MFNDEDSYDVSQLRKTANFKQVQNETTISNIPEHMKINKHNSSPDKKPAPRTPDFNQYGG